MEVGDLVMLNAKNIRTKRTSKKLSPKLYGSFKVLEKKGSQAYKLEISPRWKIHPVFHVSLLEPYRASNRPDREQPPGDPEEIEGDLEWEVERIEEGINRGKSFGILCNGKAARRMKIHGNPARVWETRRKRWKGFIERTRRCRARERLSNIRKIFHRWTSKHWWFLPLLCGARKWQRELCNRHRVFGTNTSKRRARVRRTDSP